MRTHATWAAIAAAAAVLAAAAAAAQQRRQAPPSNAPAAAPVAAERPAWAVQGFRDDESWRDLGPAPDTNEGPNLGWR